MRRPRHLLAAVMFATAVTVAPPSAAPVSAGDTPKCVDGNELKAVRIGNSKATVHKVFDFRGSFVRSYLLGGRSFELRTYKRCGANRKEFSYVDVLYTTWTASDKVHGIELRNPGVFADAKIDLDG